MAKVTLATIKATFPGYRDYEQIDRKQLFVASNLVNDKGGTIPHQLLISYTTVVGRRYFGKSWELTKKRYSVTTTEQLKQFAQGRNVTWIDNL